MAIGNIPGVAPAAVQNPALQTVQAPRPGTPANRAVFFDPADTNQDGVVSPAEALAYALAHPMAELLKTAQAGAATYGANGAANPGAAVTGGLNLQA